MDPLKEYQTNMSRRQLLAAGNKIVGATALATLLPGGLTHFAPRARRVIYLFMAGGPSHIDTFDYHPRVRELHGIELPATVRMGQRITTMTSGQKSFPVAAPMFKFQRYGQHGTWVSELLPHVSKIVDEICILKSLHTEAINHDPAITFINTGSQQPGKPSMGAWLSYGLGSPKAGIVRTPLERRIPARSTSRC